MKSKSILIVGILAIFSFIFVLSGCDEILEAFYPDFGKNAGGNEIRVDVDISPELANWDVRVYGRVESANLDPGDPDYFHMDINVPIDFSQYDEQGNPIPKAFLDFWGIPNGEYKVLVWLDNNGNQVPDPSDEPVTFAKWNDSEDPNTENFTDIFYFPNHFDWSTISGNAFLGKGADNLNFYFNGCFALGTTPGTVSYSFWPYSDERRITDVSWEVKDSNNNYVSDGSAVFDGVDAGNVNIDYSAIDPAYPGWYRLWVNITYTDGASFSRNFPLLVGEEELDGTPYSLNLILEALNDDPLRLNSDTAYTYWVDILDYNFDVVNSEILKTSEITDPNGDVILLVSGLYYHNTSSTGGNYWVRVTVDVNNDGNIDPGDFSASMPISLADGDGQVDITMDAWDFYPIFE